MTKTSSRSSRSLKKAKSPSHSQKKPISISSSGHSQKNGSSTQSVNNTAQSGPSRISYEKNGRTDLIIDWLTENVNDRTRLFSDNVQDASAEGRCMRTAKTSKMIYYRKIAVAIFENDQEEQANYAKEPERYAKSVENHIRGYVVFIVCMPSR